MSEADVLTPVQIAAFLREHVTVVKPGETLVVRLAHLTQAQHREYQEALNTAAEYSGWPKVIVVVGDELGVVQADTDAAFAARVARAQQQNAMRSRFPMRPA